MRGFVAMGLALLCGCSFGSMVSSRALPLRRVVVYRNGVAYFEREGTVSADQVTFSVRAGHVGDFLATLAVIEKGGSSVRSASFPTEVKKQPGQAEPLVDVVLRLDGGRHDLQVGYVAETPVWRPSYRLVVGGGGAELQAWGIVHNQTGEDWKDVSLSLVAGAPIAFEATLGDPVTPRRPTVTDTGEVIAAVPRGETTLAAERASGAGRVAGPRPSAKKADQWAPPASQPAADSAGFAGLDEESGEAEDRHADYRPRNLSALAAVAVEGGLTRFDIPARVTIPDKSATMVLLIAKKVPGEVMFLFAPDGGVPDSMRHPFRVARFTNDSAGLLEKGPIAIFEAGSFLGQGMVEPIPAGATATVSFALERSLAVESRQTQDSHGARVAKIEAGSLTIQRDTVVRTTYTVRNGGGQTAKVFVRHPRDATSRLVDPPKGTEDNVGTRAALVPIEVEARSTTDLVVEERRAFATGIDWLSPMANDAVLAYVSDKRADPEAKAKLLEAWELRKKAVEALDEQKKLKDEQHELERATNETRANLKALEKNTAATDLVAKLTGRLSEYSARMDGITKRLVELDMQSNEQRVRFTELVRQVKVAKPLDDK